MDEYQARYLAHQKRKADSLTSNFGVSVKPYSKKEQDVFFKIVNNRCSQRVFTNEEVNIEPILKAIQQSPSSCNRKAIKIEVITDRKYKEILSGLLVGGVGWCHRGTILLLKADMNAYKNPEEVNTMPYLDAGVIIQTAYLTAEVLNLGCCFVNPHVREEYRGFFGSLFLEDNEIFCGAIILGKYLKKHK